MEKSNVDWLVVVIVCGLICHEVVHILYLTLYHHAVSRIHITNESDKGEVRGGIPTLKLIPIPIIPREQMMILYGENYRVIGHEHLTQVSEVMTILLQLHTTYRVDVPRSVRSY